MHNELRKEVLEKWKMEKKNKLKDLKADRLKAWLTLRWSLAVPLFSALLSNMSAVGWRTFFYSALTFAPHAATFPLHQPSQQAPMPCDRARAIKRRHACAREHVCVRCNRKLSKSDTWSSPSRARAAESRHSNRQWWRLFAFSSCWNSHK